MNEPVEPSAALRTAFAYLEETLPVPSAQPALDRIERQMGRERRRVQWEHRDLLRWAIVGVAMSAILCGAIAAALGEYGAVVQAVPFVAFAVTELALRIVGRADPQETSDRRAER